MNHDVKKPVMVSDKATLKPVSSASETSLKIEISLVASLIYDMSQKQVTKALIKVGLRLCCWQTLKTSFLALRPICSLSMNSGIFPSPV